MPIAALQITPELIEGFSAMTDEPEGVSQMLDDIAYAVVDFQSAREFHVTLMTEDEILVAAANNPDIQIVTA